MEGFLCQDQEAQVGQVEVEIEVDQAEVDSEDRAVVSVVQGQAALEDQAVSAEDTVLHHHRQCAVDTDVLMVVDVLDVLFLF